MESESVPNADTDRKLMLLAMQWKHVRWGENAFFIALDGTFEARVRVKNGISPPFIIDILSAGREFIASTVRMDRDIALVVLRDIFRRINALSNKNEATISGALQSLVGLRLADTAEGPSN